MWSSGQQTVRRHASAVRGRGKNFQSGPGKAARPLILFAEVIKSFFSPRGPVHCDHSLMLALKN